MLDLDLETVRQAQSQDVVQWAGTPRTVTTKLVDAEHAVKGGTDEILAGCAALAPAAVAFMLCSSAQAATFAWGCGPGVRRVGQKPVAEKRPEANSPVRYGPG